MFSNEQWLANSGANFYNGVATQSLRFNDDDSAYLTKTPSSASNRKTWTWSGWVKRGNLSSWQMLFAAGTTAGDRTYLAINDSNYLVFNHIASSTPVFYSNSDMVFRDCSAWYHLVVKCDLANTTVNIYVNGQQIDLTLTSGSFQNVNTYINNNTAHFISKSSFASQEYLDGYLAEVNFIDGLALTPTSFGEFKNGVWIPIDTSGLTFGTNGFRLKFDQVGVGTASSSTIGADTSGNTNHWTSGGIVASDCAMPDSPENNFATLNPLNNPDGTFSEGNLKWLSTTTDQRIALATMPVDSLGARRHHIGLLASLVTQKLGTHECCIEMMA